MYTSNEVFSSEWMDQDKALENRFYPKRYVNGSLDHDSENVPVRRDCATLRGAMKYDLITSFTYFFTYPVIICNERPHAFSTETRAEDIRYIFISHRSGHLMDQKNHLLMLLLSRIFVIVMHHDSRYKTTYLHDFRSH